VTGSDLHIAQVSASVEHGRDIGVTEHVRVRPGDLDAGGFGKPVQAAGGRMAVHPAAAAVEQNRPAGTQAYRPVDSPAAPVGTGDHMVSAFWLQMTKQPDGCY
jgi:hypothetical protein